MYNLCAAIVIIPYFFAEVKYLIVYIKLFVRIRRVGAELKEMRAKQFLRIAAELGGKSLNIGADSFNVLDRKSVV